MRYITPLLALLICTGCSVVNNNPTNIVDITDYQEIQMADGTICQSKEMLIYSDRIEYYYPDCSIRRVVRVKPHILPKVK